MPQLRQDPTTKEWVIIASERSRRPHDFVKTETSVDKPAYKEDCPFCPGNDHWHLQIIPRITNLTGFELGSGIYINVSSPEEAAQFLRED